MTRILMRSRVDFSLYLEHKISQNTKSVSQKSLFEREGLEGLEGLEEKNRKEQERTGKKRILVPPTLTL